MQKQESSKRRHEEVEREHAALRDALGALHRVLAQRQGAVATVAEQLCALGDDVAEHFSDEETAGFFDDLLAQAPHLANRIDQLREEHQQLSDTIERLKVVAVHGDGSAPWWEQLEAAFHAFSKELMHHEATENELLVEAYTDDIGAAD